MLLYDVAEYGLTDDQTPRASHDKAVPHGISTAPREGVVLHITCVNGDPRDTYWLLPDGSRLAEHPATIARRAQVRREEQERQATLLPLRRAISSLRQAERDSTRGTDRQREADLAVLQSAVESGRVTDAARRVLDRLAN